MYSQLCLSIGFPVLLVSSDRLLGPLLAVKAALSSGAAAIDVIVEGGVCVSDLEALSPVVLEGIHGLCSQVSVIKEGLL